MPSNARRRTIKEAKEPEAPEIEAGDFEDDGESGVVLVVGEDVVPEEEEETVVILSFMPWSQWPNVPQAK